MDLFITGKTQGCRVLYYAMVNQKRGTMRIFSITIILMLWCSIVSTAQACDISTNLTPYTTSDSRPFITLDGNNFIAGDDLYPVYGINYYPKPYPWRRFLTESDMDTIETEFSMMQDIGMNTLRIFLWNDALFACDGRGTQPVESAFTRLDNSIHLAAEYNFRLIATLTDMPDLTNTPLYDNPEHVQEQTRFIVSRYQDEPAILAWDLRNEGDIDYGSRGILETKFPRTQVLAWLGETADLVRKIDSNHLITAGWLHEAHSTAPYVDFISFHHWFSSEELERRITAIQLASDKPILLQEVGYSTHHANITPDVQAQLLGDIFQTVDEQGLLGWMIWTAFDFTITESCYPSPCQSPDNAEHDFGVWTVDYEPKPAVAMIQGYTDR